jgi:RNA polymerase sigma-70 factor (ECF subfamily)
MSTTEFTELLLVNSNSLKPFAMRLTKDNEVAKDLYQETLYKAYANREKYNVGTNIKAWLYTIMRNIFINDYRKSKKYKTVSDSDANNNLMDHLIPAINSKAESTIQYKEIIKAINILPEKFKSAFLLNYEGYQYHEIAEAFQEPLGTIKSRIFMARKILQKYIVHDKQ